jgi:hypothetical protein
MDIYAIVETVNAIAESRVEYETTHKDSGDNYVPLVCECWTSDHESRLVDYMKEKSISWDGLEIDDIVNQVLDRFAMVPAYVFAFGNGGFLLESFPVGEIEMQIDCDDIGTPWTRELCESLSRSSDVVFHYHGESMALGYIGTDSVWDAEISESELREIVNELRAQD